MLCKHTVGFSEAVQAISQELVDLICRVVVFMLFYGVLLSGILCFKLKSVCYFLWVDEHRKFSAYESLFPEV